MKCFYRISELMLSTLIQRYDEKIISFFYPLQKQKTNWNFTGCQMPRYGRINTMYHFIKPFLDKK